MAGGVKWTWQNAKTGSLRSFKKEVIDQIEKSIKGQKLVITDVQKQAKKKSSPGLYDLTELQRRCV